MLTGQLTLILVATVVFESHILTTTGSGAPCLTQALSAAKPTDDWVLDTSSGIPVQIAFGLTPINNPYVGREIFLLVEDGYCFPQLLSKVFSGLAARYPQPKSLWIHVYSDPEMMRRAIARSKYPDDMIFPDTPEGVQLEMRIRGDLYIPKTGWARARYHREPKGGESFAYKPDPEKVEMIEVVLKSREAPPIQEDQADLFLACRLGDIDKAAALITRGVMIDCRNTEGETPLVHAVRYNRYPLVKLLLDHGASVDATNKYGVTVFAEAVTYGGTKTTLLLLQHNANVNVTYGNGRTPLHVAAHNGNLRILQALLSRGADPNATDNQGNTPLFDAIGNSSRNGRIVLALLQGGARANVRNRQGVTPLMRAKRNSDQAIIEMLRTHGGTRKARGVDNDSMAKAGR